MFMTEQIILNSNQAKVKMKEDNLWKISFTDKLLNYEDFLIKGVIQRWKQWNQEYFITATFDKKSMEFVIKTWFNSVSPVFVENVTVNDFVVYKNKIEKYYKSYDLVNFWFKRTEKENDIWDDILRELQSNIWTNNVFTESNFERLQKWKNKLRIAINQEWNHNKFYIAVIDEDNKKTKKLYGWIWKKRTILESDPSEPFNKQAFEVGSTFLRKVRKGYKELDLVKDLNTIKVNWLDKYVNELDL